MINKSAFFAFFFSSFVLLADVNDHIIDLTYNSYENPIYRSKIPKRWDRHAFNSAPEFGPLFAQIKEHCHIKACIETGTYQGETALLLSALFPQVHTIELNHSFYEEALKNLYRSVNVHCYDGGSGEIKSQPLSGLVDDPAFLYLDAHWKVCWPPLLWLSLLSPQLHTQKISQIIYATALKNRRNLNINCYEGSSEQVMSMILPQLVNEPLFFYLDAHWHNFWPLLDELDEISKTHRDNCVIVIDDFKVPGRSDIGFDGYGEDECSYEYIKEHLDKIYSTYDYYYVIPKNVQSRAKFVALPKKWGFSP